MTLHGRDPVLRAVRELRGGAVLVRGGAGTGKSALLAELRADPARRVLGVRGLRAERDLPLAALHRLFGTPVADGAAVHRLLVSLAMPTLCWVDDAQWVDEESLAALAFAARRLTGHPVAVVLASTTATDLFDELALPPLTADAADALLAERGVPAGLRPQLVELGGGNPADLVALAVALTPAQMAGREPVSEVLPARLAEYATRLAALPHAERVRTVAMAAESTVDLSGASKVTRSTWYAAATPAVRREAHALLAMELDGPNQTWHRAMAAGTPELARELAAAPAADHATAARQLERAAVLTTDPVLRDEWLFAAATAAWQAGRAGWARLLLSRVDTPTGATALLHGEIELRDGDPAVATHELTAAATLHENPARALLLAGEARRLSGDLHGYQRLATRTLASPVRDELLRSHFHGLAATFAGDHRAAAGPLETVVQLGLDADDVASAVWAAEAAFALGDGERAHECAAVAVGRARLGREHARLPWALVFFSLSAIVLDRLPCAVAAATEGMAGPHNQRMEHLTLLGLAAALTGVRAAELDEAAEGIAARGLGRPAAVAAWAHACLDLAADRPDDALGRLTDLAAGVSGDQPVIRVLATPQLVEAAVRAERPDDARPSHEVFDRWTRAGGSPAWLALNHRCHALLATDADVAEQHFTTAIGHHRRAGSGMELARTQLAYATMLRRRRRTRDARDLFRDALRGFEKAGAPRYADRARAGLRATGETTAPRRTTLAGLTPQQAEISRLVAVGETNKEIARRLVISHRTVDHHLRNIFTALGVRSRVELARRVAASELTR